MLLARNRPLVFRNRRIVARISVLPDRILHHLFEEFDLIGFVVPGRINTDRLSVGLASVLSGPLLADEEYSPVSTSEVDLRVLERVDATRDAQASVPGDPANSYLSELPDVVVGITLSKPNFGSPLIGHFASPALRGQVAFLLELHDLQTITRGP